MRKTLAVTIIASLSIAALGANGEKQLQAQVLDHRFTEMVVDIERNLERLGFNPGAIDGRIDNDLQKAAEKFRMQNRLRGAGQIDVELLLVTQSLLTSSSPPAASPMPLTEGPVVGSLERPAIAQPESTPRVINQGRQPDIIAAPPGRRYERPSTASPMPRVDGPVVGNLDRPLTEEPTISGPTLNHEAQELLRRLGYYDGAIDGIVGPKTRAAANSFAQDFAVPFRGINRGFVDALRAALHYRTRSSRSPTPLFDSRVPPGAIDRPDLSSAYDPRAIQGPSPDRDSIIWEPRNQGIRGEQLN